jgi:glycerol uptake facilitator-like aquaporin
MMMIAFTFSAGKWIGTGSWEIAWAFHAVGVIAADYFGGGQQVNPAVTVSMWALAKIDYTEAFVRIAGQMGGGMISFPLFHVISETLNWEPFGGPEFNKSSNGEAAISEFVSMFLLMWVIYIVSFVRFAIPITLFRSDTSLTTQKLISCLSNMFDIYIIRSSTGNSTLESTIIGSSNS